MLVIGSKGGEGEEFPQPIMLVLESRGGEWEECPQPIMLVIESRGGEWEECPQPIVLVIGSRESEPWRGGTHEALVGCLSCWIIIHMYRPLHAEKMFSVLKHCL